MYDTLKTFSIMQNSFGCIFLKKLKVDWNNEKACFFVFLGGGDQRMIDYSGFFIGLHTVNVHIYITFACATRELC